MSEQKTNWLEYTMFAEEVTNSNRVLKDEMFKAMQDIRLDKIDEAKRPLLFAACKVAGFGQYVIAGWLSLQGYTHDEVLEMVDEYNEIDTEQLNEVVAFMGPALIFYLADNNEYLNGRTTKFDYATFDDGNAAPGDTFAIEHSENVRLADWIEHETQILQSNAMEAIEDIRFRAIPYGNTFEFFAACKKCRISKDEVRFIVDDERERYPLNKGAVKDRLQMYTDMLAMDDRGIFDSVSGSLIFRLADDNDYLKKIGPTEADEALSFRWLTRVHYQKALK